MPLLYVEFSYEDRVSPAKVRRLHAGYKQATAAALKASIGSILRKDDLVAAGAGGQWFIALLTARAPGRKTFASDADLGIAAERLRRAVERSLAATQRELVPVAHQRVTVRCGWNVLEGIPITPWRHCGMPCAARPSLPGSKNDAQTCSRPLRMSCAPH